MNEIGQKVKEWRKKKGFYTPCNMNSDSSIDHLLMSDAEIMLAKLALVHSEISEAVEAVRNQDEANFREELADAILRILDIAATCEIDIEEEIEKKMASNEGRSSRNEKFLSI
jgi:NTP pyrophosphatase (non-canonical NTP hydrolase)